jgi:DNA-binding transcriptional ArsR family regulator
MPYINLHRSYQAIHLFPYLHQEYVRDGKPPKPNDTRAMFDHVVIQVLGRAMASEPKPGSKTKRNPLTVTDTCWPRLLTICRETGLSESSVRRTLDRLVANGYITKSRIPGRRLRKGNWQYDGCRYHLVREIWDLVYSPFDPAKRKKTDDVAAPIIAPLASPATRAAEQAIANTLDNQFRETDFEPPSTRNKDNAIDKIVALLKTHFAAHPTFCQVDANRIMKNCVRGCIDTAGSAELCLAIFQWICTDPGNEDKRIKLGRSKLLGGYITASFEEWLEREYPVWEEEAERENDEDPENDEDDEYEHEDEEETEDAESESDEDAEPVTEDQPIALSRE